MSINSPVDHVNSQAPEPRKKEEEVDSHDELSTVQPNFGSALIRTKSVASQAITKVTSRLSTYSTKEPGPPPDGGLIAWSQAACGWLCIFNTWGFVNSFGAFQTH